jgi:GT2 family glycosyltransferase
MPTSLSLHAQNPEDSYLSGAWRIHLPFAYDLTRELNPAVFIQLGVYKGESYFNVCRSVDENNLRTQCYGIDTWRRTPPAVFHEQKIRHQVAADNAKYARFSKLMALSFDKALSHFSDRSVDLLYINGAQRYRDVKKDFEAWQPKLTKQSIVLICDVTTDESDSGVHRLWSEIAQPRASFLFEFGYGLRLYVWRRTPVRGNDPPFFQRLFLADAAEAKAIVGHYAAAKSPTETSTRKRTTISEDSSFVARLELFPGHTGGHSAERLTPNEIRSGRWCRLKIDLPWGLGDGSAPFRFDPVDRAGVVDIASVVLRSAATGEILWRANARSGLDELTVRGTGFRLPHPRLLRLIAYSTDPQVHLPELKGEAYQEPLIFELLLRYDDAPDSIERAISAWNEAGVASIPSVSADQIEELPVTELAKAPLGEVTDDSKITMIVYSAEESGYTEERATQVTYTAQRWSHLDIALQLGLGTQSLRLDPLTAVGLIDIAAVTLRSAINDEVLWRANGGGGLEALQVSGSAVRIPHPHLARILSYGEDPQIYLPAFPGGKFDGPLRLEVWLKTETGFNSIRKGMTELAAIGSRALEQRSQTRGLLEQSTRDASQKEAEIQTLRTEMERTASDRALQIENLRTALDARISEIASQQAHIQNLEAIRRERERELENARNLLEGRQSEIASQQAHIQNLEIIRSEQGLELENLRNLLLGKQSEAASQQAHIHNLEAIQSEQGLEIENLRVLLKGRQSEAESQKTHIQNLETIRSEQGLELENLKASVEIQRSEIGSQRGHINNLEAIGTQLESEVAALHESLHQARAEAAQFLTQLETERADHLKMQADTRGEMDAQKSELGKQVENLKTTLAAAHRDSARFSNELTRASDELASRTSELGRFRQELALARNELKYATSELERVRDATIRREQELRFRVSEVERFSQEAESTMNSLAARTAELALLRAELESASAETTLLRADVIHQRRQLLGQGNEATELRLKLNAAKEKLRAHKSELEKIKDSSLWKLGKPARKLRRHFEKRSQRSLESDLYQDTRSDSYDFWLELPAGPSIAGRNIIFSGWVIGPPRRAIHGLRAIANGQTFPGQYGFAREDVARAHEGRVGSTYAGFSIEVSLPAGIHEVSLEALNNKGEWEQFLSHRHEVKSDGQDETEPGISDEEAGKAGSIASHADENTLTTGNAFLGTLESPGPSMANDTGLLVITGWVYFNDDKVSELLARMESGPAVFLTYSLLRDDVSHLPEAAASGFEGYLPIGADFSGSLTLQVYARLESGAEILCFERDVAVEPRPSPVPPAVAPSNLSENDGYDGWVRTNSLTPALLRRMARDVTRIATTGPLISVVVPTYNTPSAYLEALIDSLRTQLYPNWQLCLADDASTEPHVRSILEKAAASDSRVEFSLRSANGHIVKASNTALELVKGEYVGLLDHDDVLTPDALLQVAEAISARPAVDFLYTDEDKLSPAGARYDPIFKGAFSPEMAITHNYIQHFAVIRASLLRQVGGFRAGFEGAQDLDLYLRVIERTDPSRVQHVPFVCYHWRAHPESTASTAAQKDYVFASARRSIEEALTRRGLRATVFLPDWANQANCCLYQLRWSPELLRENPVTIVIPTKNQGDLLKKCIDSLVRTVETTHLKLIVVDDFSNDESTTRYLRRLNSRKDLDCEVIRPRSQLAEFNFSHLVNAGVAHATTPLVLLLNNDTEALEPGWLEEMVGWMSIHGVGAVGAKLLYPDGTIQHAGVIVGSHGGLAEHIFHRLPGGMIGFNFLSHAARNVTAVTAACMLTSKTAFDEVKGFDETNFGMEYNDVDFCLRLGRAGKRIVFTPQATLLHHCGKSRGVGFRPQEHVNFLKRYPGIRDAYYNGSLDLDEPGRINSRHFVHANRVGKLKVLEVSHNLNLEGAAKILLDRASYFSSAGDCQVSVLSAAEGSLRSQYDKAEIPVTIVKGRPLHEGEGERETEERLNAIGKDLDLRTFDLVICNTLTSFWGILLARNFALPVIWNIHDSTTLEEFSREAGAPAGLVENCFRHADRVVFVANTTRRMFEQYDSRGTFITIPGSVDVNGIDAYKARQDKDSLRRLHGIDPTATVVSLIGTTCARKGQHLFLEAIRKLQFEGGVDPAHVCFLMVGARESPYLDFLRDQLEASGVKNTFLIEEREDVYDFFCLSDIFVCASFRESFPRVILEAMAFRLGIVSAEVVGVQELISDGNEGFLVPIGDALQLAQRIMWLLEKGDVREELGAKAHAKATRLFNSNLRLPRYLSLAREVVAKHTPATHSLTGKDEHASPSAVTEGVEESFRGALEKPFEDTVNEDGLLHIAGWVHFDSKRLKKIFAKADRDRREALSHSIRRDDVAAALPQIPSVRESGFEGYLPIGWNFLGLINLEIEAELENGGVISCFQRRVFLRTPATESYPARTADLTADGYAGWVRTNRLTPPLIKRMAEDAKRAAAAGPQVSIVVSIYDTAASYLEALIESGRTQLYPNWQLCFVDNASQEPHVRTILDQAARNDSRIKVLRLPVNESVAQASNSALALATGDYVALLDPDGLLTPDALLHVAEAIVRNGNIDVLYADEDKISDNGERYDPVFNGAFSPEMAIAPNYLQRFTVIRRTILVAAGGFQDDFEGAQDLDLYLRVVEQTAPGRVEHLPFVCYHSRSNRESHLAKKGERTRACERSRKAITEALLRRKLLATPFVPDFAVRRNSCFYQLRWSRKLLQENPVTIVIPTRNHCDLLKKCIASLVRTVDHAHTRLIIVDDFSEDESTRRYLKDLATSNSLKCDVIQPRSRFTHFNFSQLVNEGVAHATTPLVLLLNNDTEALERGWLEDMVGWMSIEGVGAVGAKLLYANATIQHAGVLVGEHGGLAEHIFEGLGEDVIGLNFLTHLARNVSAVTAACMLTSKAVFEEVKGFDQTNFAMEFNDVDYCLRLAQAGKRIVFSPQSVLLHHGGQSRGILDFRPQERVNFLRRYPALKDPFYNESIDLDRTPMAVKPRHFVHTERVGKLKVLLVSHNLNLEGAPKILFDRASYFASIGGYEVTVASPVDGPLRKDYEDIGISVTLVQRPLPELSEQMADYEARLGPMGERLHCSSFDLLICNTLLSCWGVFLAKRFHLPVIWNIHESAGVQRFVRAALLPEDVIDRCFALADRIAFEADLTREVYNQLDSRDNFVTIAGSIDVDAIDEFCEQHRCDLLRQKHGIDSDQTVVSLVGTTCGRKGQHVFVEAIRQLQSEHPIALAKACFLIVGARESFYLEFLRARIAAVPGANIRLLEEREGVYDFFRLSDIFVCASFEESFPRVILEAMAFKLGIVSTKVFGVPEMVSDGNEAILVPAGDSRALAGGILRFVQEPQVRRAFGERAHARVSRCYANRRQLQKHLDLTKEVVARHVS